MRNIIISLLLLVATGCQSLLGTASSTSIEDGKLSYGDLGGDPQRAAEAQARINESQVDRGIAAVYVAAASTAQERQALRKQVVEAYLAESDPAKLEKLLQLLQTMEELEADSTPVLPPTSPGLVGNYRMVIVNDSKFDLSVTLSGVGGAQTIQLRSGQHRVVKVAGGEFEIVARRSADGRLFWRNRGVINDTRGDATIPSLPGRRYDAAIRLSDQ
ncbi:MAG TPA: hypothetical protein VGA49_02235 [Patescibacteria group bacterium]